jgi:hypothetical protein
MSVRTSVTPRDRVMDYRFIDLQRGLDTLGGKIITALHKNLRVLYDADRIIERDEGTNPTGFVEPLRFSSASNIAIVDGSWFFAEPDKASGMSLTINFDGAMRARNFDHLV